MPVPEVDRESLLAAFGGRSALLAEAARVFLADARGMRDRLREAVASGNLEETAAAAHAIKGAAGLFSQGAAFASAREIEQLARSGADQSALEPAHAGFDHAMTVLVEELSRLLDER